MERPSYYHQLDSYLQWAIDNTVESSPNHWESVHPITGEYKHHQMYGECNPWWKENVIDYMKTIGPWSNCPSIHVNDIIFVGGHDEPDIPPYGALAYVEHRMIAIMCYNDPTWGIIPVWGRYPTDFETQHFRHLIWHEAGHVNRWQQQLPSDEEAAEEYAFLLGSFTNRQYSGQCAAIALEDDKRCGNPSF